MQRYIHFCKLQQKRKKRERHMSTLETHPTIANVTKARIDIPSSINWSRPIGIMQEKMSRSLRKMLKDGLKIFKTFFSKE